MSRSSPVNLGHRVAAWYQPPTAEPFTAMIERLLSPDLGFSVTDARLQFFDSHGSHPSEDAGSGVLAIAHIVDALYDAEPGETILIDEPERELHPQVQRRLAALLYERSAKSQIVIATHSPYFVHWDSIKAGGKVIRVFDEGTNLTLRDPSRATIEQFMGVNSIDHPHILGLDAAEVFFVDDRVILVEGQEDVVVYQQHVKLDPPEATYFGWGVNGAQNMARIANLLQELGVSRVFGILDRNMAAIAAKLNGDFPKYRFDMIPADNVRDKRPQKERAPMEGLVTSKGELKEGSQAHFSELQARLKNYFA